MELAKKERGRPKTFETVNERYYRDMVGIKRRLKEGVLNLQDRREVEQLYLITQELKKKPVYEEQPDDSDQF